MTKLADKTVEIAAQETAAREALAAAEQEAKTELSKLAGQEALGEVTPAQARRRRAAVEKRVAARRERVDVLAAALPEIERRVAEEADKAHRAEVASAGRKLDAALRTRSSAAKSLARSLRQVEQAAVELRRHRGLVDAAAHAYSARLHKGERFEWPRGSDEDWELSNGLREFLIDGGPVRPIADAAEARAKARRIRERQDAEALRSFALQPSEALLKTLGERLQPEARKILTEHRAEAAEQRREAEERTAKRRLDRLGEETRSRPPAPVA